MAAQTFVESQSPKHWYIFRSHCIEVLELKDSRCIDSLFVLFFENKENVYFQYLV